MLHRYLGWLPVQVPVGACILPILRIERYHTSGRPSFGKTMHLVQGMPLLAIVLASPFPKRFFCNALANSVYRGRSASTLQTRGGHSPTGRQSPHRFFSTSSDTVDMAPADIASNLEAVREKISEASKRVGKPVRLVAVSKTKPITSLQAAYDAGQRFFGENYAQELVEKIPQLDSYASSESLPIYHFIGALQSNKANMLVNAIAPDVDRLVIETVASVKLANKLQNAVERLEDCEKCLDVFVQVNTSEEESKSGLTGLEEIQAVCRHVQTNCNRLKLRGLMTIGAVGDVSCFDRLVNIREAVDPKLELSMGMSGDYEAAIAAGATNVRVGSTIFGTRNYNAA